MRTTEFTLDSISSFLSSAASFDVLSELVMDMDLEIVDVESA